VAIKGMSDAKVDKIREVAKKLDCRGAQFKVSYVILYTMEYFLLLSLTD
jgi:hypothetical protein